MGVVNVLSQGLTNRDGVKRVLTNARQTGAHIRNAKAVVAITSGDSVGSTYRAFSLPSNALVNSVKLTAPDIGSTTAANCGLYQTTSNGSAVVDADFFKAANVLNGGAITKSEIGFGNVMTVANAEQPLWQLLGLSADPSIDYDVVLTLSGAADAAGAVLVEADYTI